MKKKSNKIGHNIKVTKKPISVLGRLDVLEMDDITNYKVEIDGKTCTPKLSKLILKAVGFVP